MLAVIVFGVLLTAAGLLTSWLGFTCRDGKLPMNALVGIRIPSTMVDAETWARSHQAAWGWIVTAGAGPVFSGLALLVLGEGGGLWAIGGALWLLVFIIGASVVASRAARSTSSDA
ncbi:SdpI family protein [Nesterenkonia sp. Act20]|uniref:SdpI family protein n=1 Tax=Nesterenkonia sp. Act20 TaxID=1483432 RepID=UPI001C46ADFF|nr:SdpI family protein [Nesterenkonia sp. Act20]